MNKGENHADSGVEGILGRGQNKCTDSEVRTYMPGCFENSKVASRPIGVAGVLALEHYRE